MQADFFSDHSRRVRAELNARYNECPSPWGYQEFGPRKARLGPAALVLAALGLILVVVQLIVWVS